MEKVTPHPWLKLTNALQSLLVEVLQRHFSFRERFRVRGIPSGVGDSPSLCPVRTWGSNCAPRGSVQSGLILRVQIDACTGGPRVSDLEGRRDESDGGGLIPSMMSISPPLGHGPAWLRVQNAGQVAQPAGMCDKSRTIIASSYAFRDEMRMLSRPRADGLTTN